MRNDQKRRKTIEINFSAHELKVFKCVLKLLFAAIQLKVEKIPISTHTINFYNIRLKRKKYGIKMKQYKN